MTSLDSLKILFILFCPLFSVAQMQFVENKGQWNSKVQYKTDIKAGAFFIEKNGFAIILHNQEELEKLSGHSHSNEKIKESTPANDTLHSHAIKVKFIAALANAVARPGKKTDAYNNYFIGSDKSKWQSGCNIFEEVVYKNIYPNIDVRYYSHAGSIKYDFVLHAGADANAIVLQYDGASKLEVKNNELYISTSLGEIKESVPYTYQLINGERKKVNCNYVIKGNSVSFNVKKYNKQAELVIDPAIIFSSFSGSTADNWGNCATPAPDGSLFSAGIVFDTGYPISAGAFDQTFNGGNNEDANGPYDIGLFKFSANGASRLYATYLGGSGNEQVHSMACDAQGNLVVMGRTNSPITSASGIAYPITRAMVGNGGLYDIAVTKFNAAGTALLGSVRMGGTADDGINIRAKYAVLGVPGQGDGAYDTRRNYGDDNRGDILIDNNNNVYIASSKQSPNFPVNGSFIQSIFGGGGTYIQQDGIIARFNADLSITNFCTFFGGSGNDACISLAINEAAGNLYVAGATTSTNLPGNTFGTVAPSYQGGVTDGFISIIKTDGSSIVKTTYEGTSGNDMLYGLQLDKSGFVYITGTTTGNKPVINAAFSQTGGKQFISKLNSNLSSYIYSTNFGTNISVPNICPTAFGIDKCENVYVAGWGGALNAIKQYPNTSTTGLVTTANAFQATTDGNDFYLFALGKNASSQLYGSFFGQNGGFTDHCDGSSSRFDNNGVLYQTICANCGATPGVVYPTTTGVWATANASISCNQAALKFDMRIGIAVAAGFKATQSGLAKDTVCTSSVLVFTDTILNARKFIWNFMDGSAETIRYLPANTISHSFSNPGIYNVRLVAADSFSCNLADTFYRSIVARDCSDSAFCN